MYKFIRFLTVAKSLFGIVIMVVLISAACDIVAPKKGGESSKAANATMDTNAKKSSKAAESTAASSEAAPETRSEKTSSGVPVTFGRIDAPEFNVPEYNGEDAWTKVHDDIPFLTEMPEAKPYIKLSEFDSLGRCGTAEMVAGPETLPTGKRGPTGSAKPTGWVQKKYEGIVDSEPPFLYNRAHLLMYAASGLTDETHNLITGTRYFNTVGMLETEMELVQHIQETGHHVFYRVTPVFVGDELLARGVLMEAQGLEDNFRFCRFAFNVQPGVVLDYQTGESHLESEEAAENTEEEEMDFVLNTHTMKYHSPDCVAVQEMNPKNKAEFHGKISELIENGYSPCGSCQK